MKGLAQMINEKATYDIYVCDKTIKKYLNKKGMEQSTVEWYRSEFPDDGAWEDMKDVTFSELLSLLAEYDRNDGKNTDMEPYIGYDSIIRERLFRHISDLTGITYPSLYNKYFGKSPSAYNFIRR